MFFSLIFYGKECYSNDLISFLQAEYSEQPYEFLLTLNDLGYGEKHFKAEVKFRDKLYSLTANKTDQLFIELHIDRLRDIHLILRGIMNELVRELGFELMWDANRDPTQKVCKLYTYLVSDFIIIC